MFQEGFVHGANDGAHLAMGDPGSLPGLGRLEHCGLQPLHHPAQGRRRTSHLRLETQMREKLADRFEAHAALEPEDIKGCHYQTREPTSALLGFPQPRLRVVPTACDGPCETMHTALRKPRLLGNAADTLRAVVTKTLANAKAFGPKSHVGLSSEG